MQELKLFVVHTHFFLKHKGLAFLEKSQSLDERGKFTSSFPDNCRKVIESWNTLQEGGSIKGKHYISMVKNINKETSIILKIMYILDDLPQPDKEYIYELLRHWHKIR